MSSYKTSVPSGLVVGFRSPKFPSGIRPKSIYNRSIKLADGIPDLAEISLLHRLSCLIWNPDFRSRMPHLKFSSRFRFSSCENPDSN